MNMIVITAVNGVVQFITVFILFIFVLGLTYFTTRFVGNYQKNKFVGNNVKILETMRLSSNKYVQVVSVGDKCFAIAVCKDTVTLLGEIDKESLIVPSENSTVNLSFDALFKKSKSKISKDNEDDAKD